ATGRPRRVRARANGLLVRKWQRRFRYRVFDCGICAREARRNEPNDLYGAADRRGVSSFRSGSRGDRGGGLQFATASYYSAIEKPDHRGFAHRSSAAGLEAIRHPSLTRQTRERFGQHKRSLGDRFRRGVFVWTMADTSTAWNEQHRRWRDFRHEEGVMIRAADHAVIA